MVTSREKARRPDIVCLSHLRWDSVYQRPHHLMSRFGEAGRVFYWEEPVQGTDADPSLQVTTVAPGIRVARPQLAEGLDRRDADPRRALRHHQLPLLREKAG